jgi:hypothetical protein
LPIGVSNGQKSIRKSKTVMAASSKRTVGGHVYMFRISSMMR